MAIFPSVGVAMESITSNTEFCLEVKAQLMELKDPVEFVIRELAKRGQEVADYYNAEDIGEGTVQEQALEYSDIFNEFIVKLNKLIPTITKVEVEDALNKGNPENLTQPKQKKQKKANKKLKPSLKPLNRLLNTR